MRGIFTNRRIYNAKQRLKTSKIFQNNSNVQSPDISVERSLTSSILVENKTFELLEVKLTRRIPSGAKKGLVCKMFLVFKFLLPNSKKEFYESVSQKLALIYSGVHRNSCNVHIYFDEE